MADDIEEVKKMTVEERIEKLREIEKKKNEEIKKAHELLVNSEVELKEKEEERQKLPIPQLKVEDDATLFGEEEKDMYKMKRFASKTPTEKKEKELVLEEAVAEEEIKLTPEQMAEQQHYRMQLIKEPAEQLYNEIKNLYEGIENKGYVNPNEQQKIENIQYAMDKKVEDIESGAYNASNYVANTLDKTQEMAHKMKSMYKGH